jgi:hypothetical protein
VRYQQSKFLLPPRPLATTSETAAATAKAVPVPSKEPV